MLVPLLTHSTRQAHEIVARPYSSRIRPSASAALTSIDGAEEKGYEHLPALDESVAEHSCPPTSIGWKARVSQPSLVTAGPPHKQPTMCLSPRCLRLGAEESVFMDPHGPTIAPMCPTDVIADKIKHTFSKRE